MNYKFSKVRASEIIESLEKIISKHDNVPVLVLSECGYISDISAIRYVADDPIVGHDYILIED
jgi:hypothetical protein